MTEEEKIICKQLLDDADKTHSCNEYRLLMKLLEQEPCEDAISRQAVLAIAGDSCLDLDCYDDTEEFCNQIRALPSVTPQEPRKGYLSIDDVMSVFDDFMCGKVDEEGVEAFLEMLKDKAESEKV